MRKRAIELGGVITKMHLDLTLKVFEHERLKEKQGQMLEKPLILSDITKMLF